MRKKKDSLGISENLGNVESGYTVTHKLIGAYVNKKLVPYSDLPKDVREEMLYDMGLIELYRDGISYVPRWVHTKNRYQDDDFKTEVWVHGDGIPVAWNQ